MDNLGDAPRYVLMITLPREIEALLETRLLQETGVTRPAMGYHVSVLGPFALGPGISPAWQAAVRHVCAARGPYALRLRGLAVYTSGSANLLVVPVTPVARLRSLHAALRRALGGSIMLQRDEPPAAYRPHVTLGLGISDEQAAAVLRMGSHLAPDASFTADTLWLAEQRPWEAWHVLERVPLGRISGG